MTTIRIPNRRSSNVSSRIAPILRRLHWLKIQSGRLLSSWTNGYTAQHTTLLSAQPVFD